MRVSHYEMYEANYGQWALVARFQPKDEALARTRAEKNWTASRVPTMLLQESIPDDGSEVDISTVYRSPDIRTAFKAPDSGGSMAGSLITIGINSVVIGGVGAVIGAITLAGSPARFFLTILIFFIVAAAAAMALFRMMVPMELMMWRSKTPLAKKKTIETLLVLDDAAPPKPQQSEQPLRPRRARQGAFSHPKDTVIVPEPGPDGVMNMADPAAMTPDQQPLDLQELIARQVAILTAFTADMMTVLGPRAATLQAFDRYGINLYLAGGAEELAFREMLTEQTVQRILGALLRDLGTGPEVADSFCERLNSAKNRPRFKAMMDAGRAAMVAYLDSQPIPPEVGIEPVLSTWSNPHGEAGAAQKLAVLLTDLVGSTDATAKLGNSGAQRLLRAHNAIVRAALKEYRGTEVKHTGDGILAIFTSPGDAANAGAMMQQDSFAYVRDNPELPLAIRIGVEYGEGQKDETGEYFGPAFTAIEGICDAGGNGDVAVSPMVKEQSESSTLRYVELTPSPTAKLFIPGLFKVLWEPKRVYNAPPLEYRQIGTGLPVQAEDENSSS